MYNLEKVLNGEICLQFKGLKIASSHNARFTELWPLIQLQQETPQVGLKRFTRGQKIKILHTHPGVKKAYAGVMIFGTQHQ